MRRAVNLKKEAARGVSRGGMGTLFSIKPAKSTAILPEERLASEVQALLNKTAGVFECATDGHGRCANSGCGCRCHHSRAHARSNRRISN
jgi:hypothetical protein